MKHEFKGDQLVAVRVTNKNLKTISDELQLSPSARNKVLLEPYVRMHERIYLVADKSVNPPRWKAMVGDWFANHFEFVDEETPNALQKVVAK